MMLRLTHNQNNLRVLLMNKQECSQVVGSFWDALRPSTIKELKQLETEAYEEAKSVIKKNPIKAKVALKHVMFEMDLRKIVADMYVWQRVDAVKKGINRAL